MLMFLIILGGPEGGVFVLEKFLIFTLIINSIFLASCAERRSIYENASGPGDERVIENVPFIKQKDSFCGPAAMASVMRFYGRDINQEEIAKVVYTAKLNGALISDMENYARGMGYKAETKNGDVDLLMSLIDEGTPAITLVDLGRWIISQPHYYVVYGYDKSKKKFLLHTGFARDQEISFSRLDKEWKKMDRLVLIIRK
jgi:ABC-type bacteriocin/lantibiotic exporter with double-glycine peptidase domain